ncbi:MAG TPA: flavodoxin, partial [Pseudomonas sp.]|nr:flavodoxin [Pseudomonas sp.]HBB22161.1 flavodoxin [Pseudomonas sp.]
MKVAILSGSVYGTAEDVARHAERQLKAAGFDAWHDPRAQLQQILDFAP